MNKFQLNDSEIFWQLEFEPRDLWIGLYWTIGFCPQAGSRMQGLDVYICLLPCFPLHLFWEDK